jgi:hypothetical protein
MLFLIFGLGRAPNSATSHTWGEVDRRATVEQESASHARFRCQVSIFRTYHTLLREAYGVGVE